MRSRTLLSAVASVLLLVGAIASIASATNTPLPVEVSGPVDGGNGQATAAGPDLAGAGYTEAEYFFAGDATRSLPRGRPRVDGVWKARAVETDPFRSRMIVRRPQDPARFSGTVIVEWLNVSIGRDVAPVWGYSAAEITREGHAWVGVSAQTVGVRALVDGDPQRYGTLDHPGDAFSFDIFTQAARALVHGVGASPLGRLGPEVLIAVGESQSASFLSTYINAVHPRVDVFDGFLVHSRLGGVPNLSGILVAPIRLDEGTPIRDDLHVPTLLFVTETDLTVLGYAGARQPDSKWVRTWEVAGAAHADAWILRESARAGASGFSCPGPVNDGPHHQTLRAALHHLVAWVRTGVTPPSAPPIELETQPTAYRGARIARDANGNARGGIRTPAVDVPIATLSGESVPGSTGACALFGTTTPFDATTLARLYRDHASYVEAYTASTEKAVDAGFILRPEADEMIDAARQSVIGIAA
jgi:hypothetical protein